MQLASCVACSALLLVLSLQPVLTSSEDYSEVTELPPPPQVEEHTQQQDDILPEVVVHLAPAEHQTEQSTTSTTEEQPLLQAHRQKKSPYCVQIHGGAPHEGPYEVCDQKSGAPYNGGRPDYDPLHNLAQAAIASAAYGAAHYATHPDAPPLTPHVLQPPVYSYPSEPIVYEANYQALPTYAALKAPYVGPSGSYGERISLMPAYTSSGSSKMRADSEEKPKRLDGLTNDTKPEATTHPSTGRASDYNPPSMYHHAQPAPYQTPYQMPMKVFGYVSASPVGFGYNYPAPYGGGHSYSAPHTSYEGKVGGHSSGYGNAGTAYGREYSAPSPSYASGGSYGSSSPSSSYSSSSYGGHGSSYTAPSSASHTYVNPGSGTNYSSGNHKGGYSSYSGSKGTDGSYNGISSYNAPKTSPSYSGNHYGSNHPSGSNYASPSASPSYSYAGNSYGAPHHYSASPSYGSAQSYNSAPYAAAPSYAPAYPYAQGSTYTPAISYTSQPYNPQVAPQSAAYGASYRGSSYGSDHYSPYSPSTAYAHSMPYGSNYGTTNYGGPYGGGYSTAYGNGGYGRPVEAQNYGPYGSGAGYTSGPVYTGYTGGGGYGANGPYQGPSIPLSISCQVQPANMHPAMGGYETYRESNEPANHMASPSHKPFPSHPQQQQVASSKQKGTTHKSSSEESDEKQKAREDAATTPRLGALSKPVADDPNKTPATGGPRQPSQTPTSATLPTPSARSSSGGTRFPPPPFPVYGQEYY